MSNDPTDIRAHAQADMGLSRELQQVQAIESDPSRGGSCGYDIPDCEWMLEHATEGHPVRASSHYLGCWQERIDC
jgi:hypothetical protein